MSEISYINISTTHTFISTCLKSLTSIYLQLLPLYQHVRNLLHQYIYNSYLYIYMSEISYINISTTHTFISTCLKSLTSIYLQLLPLYQHVRNLLHQYIYNSYLYIYMSEISYINISTTPTFISTCLKSLTSIYLQLLPLYLHV